MIRINRPNCPNLNALGNHNYKHPDNKNALERASYCKCMYCESKVSQVYYGDIEHIKPKSKYPELEFEWENLGFICAKCNGKKGNKYCEATPYINPYEEDPSEYLATFGVLILQKQGSERGEKTISDIKLNRPELVERRKERIDLLMKAIDACFRTQNDSLRQNALEEIRKEAVESKEYSLCIRQLLNAHDIM